MTMRTTVTVYPLRTDADYRAALAEVERLMTAAPGSPDEDRLDVLATLVDAYESRHFPIDPPDPIEAIRFRMEQQGLAPKDLEPFIGGRGRVSEVLNRKRPLTLAMIRRLAAGFGIAADVLIRSSPSVPRSAKQAAGKRSRTQRRAAR